MMTTQQIFFSMFMLGCIATSNATDSQLDSTKSIAFKLNSKTFFEQPPVPQDTKYLVEKIGNGEYDFEPIDWDEASKKIEEYDDRICLYCPDIKALILNANNRMDCKNLHLRFLSEEVKELKEENRELKQHLTFLEKQNSIK